MSELILQLILFSSFAVIVYMMAVAVPRVKDDELTPARSKAGILPLDKMDAFLNVWKEKVLRRLRIYLLRAESSVSGQLQKSKSFTQIKRKKILEKPEEPEKPTDS